MTNIEEPELDDKDFQLINPVLAPVDLEVDGAEVEFDDPDPESLEDEEVEEVLQAEFEGAKHALDNTAKAGNKPVLGGKYVIVDRRRYKALLARWRKNNVAKVKAKRAGNRALVRKLTINNRAIAKQLAALRKPTYGTTGVIGPVEGFTWRELACTDGTPVPTRYRGSAVVLTANLNKMRAEIKDYYNAEQVTIRVNSAYRSPNYNARIGGVSNSQHVYAKAADICVFVKVKNQPWKQVPIKALAVFASRVSRFRNGGIGTYVRSNFVHVDTRSGASRWSG